MKSCREISFLMSQRLDRPLTVTERLAIKIHRIGCKGCARYETNLAVIRKACEEVKNVGNEPDKNTDD